MLSARARWALSIGAVALTRGTWARPTRTAETANEAAFMANAGASPNRVTSRPPRMGPAITAIWKVVDTSALAATRLSLGTRFGSEAWKLGWKSPPNSPRQNATAYRWTRDVDPPTNSDATASARRMSAVIMSRLRDSRSIRGPPSAPTAMDGATWRISRNANDSGPPPRWLRLVATASE